MVCQYGLTFHKELRNDKRSINYMVGDHYFTKIDWVSLYVKFNNQIPVQMTFCDLSHTFTCIFLSLY